LVQGGTERVLSVLKTLAELGVPVAAVWLQDWCGQRKTSFGEQPQQLQGGESDELAAVLSSSKRVWMSKAILTMSTMLNRLTFDT
jgi:hypothetical protein